jgi:hypothetical protein
MHRIINAVRPFWALVYKLASRDAARRSWRYAVAVEREGAAISDFLVVRCFLYRWIIFPAFAPTPTVKYL